MRNIVVATSSLLMVGTVTVLGCAKEAPPVPAVAPEASAPAAEPPSAPSTDSAAGRGDAALPDGGQKSKLPPTPTDGLSLAERMERRKAAEAKLATQLADQERKRLMAYDKARLPLHTQMFAFIKKTRADYDKAKTPADVEKARQRLEKALPVIEKKLTAIDPKGGNSNVVTDYDVMLHALSNDYPAALADSFAGDKQGLAEQKGELDRRTKKIDDWLRSLKK